MDHILLLINDPGDERPSAFARRFAERNQAQLHIGRTSKAAKLQLVTDEGILTNSPVTENMADLSGLGQLELAMLIREQGYRLVIVPVGYPDLQSLMDKLSCPILLLPEECSKNIERVAYLCDLRYCQQFALLQLARLKIESLLLAHTCLPGLPDLEARYSQAIFQDTVKQVRHHTAIFYSHIREKQLNKVADTLTSTLQADLLAVQNRQYHFRQLLGDAGLNNSRWSTTPLLIFPC